MALVDPNIAMGFRGIEVPNQLAQYGQLAQIQNAQQANQLNQMRMAEYELEKRNKNALSAAYVQSFDPTTGKVDYSKLTGLMASGGLGSNIPSVLKQRTEEEQAATQAAAQRAKLVQDTQAMYRDLSGQIKTKEDAASFLQTMLNDPAMKDAPITRIPLMQQIQRIPEDPQGLDDWIKRFSLGATKYITENKPVTFSQDTGGGGRMMSRPGLGGMATVVPGSEYTKTATIADNLAASKFAFEKANPGYEVKEGEDGTMYGVNKRTLQAVPITIGAAAPAGGAPVAGVSAGAAPAGGAVPFKGKGTALNEGQGNATAFGMRMFDANKLLSDLEKSGTTSGGRIKGAVEGTLTSLVPFQGERLAAGAGSLMNAAPAFLGGPNENQQSYAQAKENFITAVLRKESGASISPDEFAREERKYFPQAGEGDKIIKQKQRARDLAIEAMKIQAGPGAKSIGGAGVLPNANTDVAPTVSNW